MLKSYFWTYEQKVICITDNLNEPIPDRDNIRTGLLD